MNEKSTGRELLDDLLLGVAAWGGGAALFGAIEAMTNTATGLYQPLGTWLFSIAVYLVLGVLAGLGGGLLVFVWRRIPFLPRIAVGPLLGALFLGGLFFVFLGLPLNDRVLPDTLSVQGLLGNGIFALITAGLILPFYLILHSRSVPWGFAFVNLVVWLSVLLVVGDHLDVFVQPIGLSVSGLTPYLILLAICVAMYLIIAWALRAIIVGTQSATVPAGVLALVAVVAVILVGRFHTGGSETEAPAPSGKPNVLWLVMDTTRADHLTPYGYDRETSPVLDQMAKDGALFEEFHAESSWTIPGHFLMVTGRFDAAREKLLREEFTTAAEVFRGAGYETAAVLGNMSLGRGSGFEQGFDETVDGPVRIFYQSAFEKLPVIKILMALGIAPPDAILRSLHRKTFLQNGAVRAERINEDAIDWLDGRDTDRPFFLFINYMDPHDAYDPPEEFRAKFAADVDPELGFVRYSRKHGGTLSSNAFVRDVASQYEETEWNEMLDLYDAEIAYVDAKIGELLEELDARGVADDTIVIVTSDHGELFGEHGLANHFKALTREETHVPLLIRYPGRIPAGKRIRTPAQLRDLMPTVLELADLPGPEMDGTSLVAMMDGETSDLRDGEVVGFLYRPVDKEYEFTKPGHLLSRRDDGSFYVWSSTGMHGYYDTENDPAEDENLHGEHPDEPAAKERFETWRTESGFGDFGGKQKKVDRLMKDKLKALGYVN